MAYIGGFHKETLRKAAEWRARLRAKIFWFFVGVTIGFLMGVAAQ